jgi:UDP-galactose transporter B1
MAHCMDSQHLSCREYLLIKSSSITWAILQERITTTPYGTENKPQKFTYSIFLNTVQSCFAALSGLAYLYTSTSHPHKPGRPAPIFPTAKILFPLLLVSITSSLASPFGYASLKHVDYVTFILAKSSKLLPVMFLHLTIFRKSFPLYKYAVVAMVTLGVAVFTLHHPSTASKAAKHGSKSAGEKNLYWGLFLLGVNLIMDGLTNSTQDWIFTKFKPYSGPQMMCAQNIMATALTVTYLFVAPYIGPTAVGQYIGMDAGSELTSAIAFIKQNPAVFWDIIGFAICGAIGQVFIYHTLSIFSSMILVTVTVTRKMLTMIVSVFAFGHSLSGMQWGGVGLVFAGIGGEAFMNKREKDEKAKKARARILSLAGQERARRLSTEKKET